VFDLKVFYLTLRLKIGGELWESVSLWKEPDNAPEWAMVVLLITEAIKETAAPLVSFSQRIKLNAVAERAHLHGHPAKLAAAKLQKIGSGKMPAMTWVCLQTKHYELGGEG